MSLKLFSTPYLLMLRCNNLPKTGLSATDPIADAPATSLLWLMVKIVPYSDEHFDGVQKLWEEVFPSDPPWNRAAVAVPEKLAVQADLFLIAEDDGTVVGSAMVGYDGHRGWLYTIAVKPAYQRNGIGSLLVGEAERKLQALGCGKVNLQIRAGNEAVSAFYRRHGYEVEERVSMGKRLPG